MIVVLRAPVTRSVMTNSFQLIILYYKKCAVWMKMILGRDQVNLGYPPAGKVFRKGVA